MVLYSLGWAEASMIFAGHAPVGDMGPPYHEPYPRSGVSAERRWLLFPRIAALCRDAATPGFMVPMRALPISSIRLKDVAVSTPASPPSRTFPAILARWFRQLQSVRERSARR